MTKATTKRDKSDNVFLPQDFEDRRDRAISKALDRYWKEMWLMGPSATMVRLAFKAGFIAGMEFEDDEKWRKMIAGLGNE